MAKSMVSADSSVLTLWQQRKAVEDRNKKLKSAMDQTGLTKKQLKEIGKILNMKEYKQLIEYAKQIGKFGVELIEYIKTNNS
jgi:uncharacterized protein YaaR (DUF327 family)